MVVIVAAASEEMFEEEDAGDGEVVESDVALLSVPAGAAGRSALRSHASTPKLSAALKKAASSMKANLKTPLTNSRSVSQSPGQSCSSSMG